ncbi:MAG: elongation factor Ts [Lachnospiraceae bacterium]|nr:elongation factor Ts [Lachnospiraceae bacterium]
MAAITAALVKELREMTGAGMMDCKKALSATDGDMDKAVEFLREKGLAAAAKKAGRIAAEGLVTAKVEGKKAVIVEVNSETDFVAKNAEFQQYVADVASQIFNGGAATIEELMAEPWAPDTSLTVEQALSEKIARIGEKLSIRRFAKIEAENGMVVAYIHGGGRIGVLVEAETEAADNAEAAEAVKNIAMQIAALRPQYISRADVPADFIEKETEILRAQIMNDPKEAAKPEKVINGMIQGRIAKELKEFCLSDQPYVKAEDGKQTVAQYLAQVSKAVGADITLKNFVRFETGEGIQKKEEDFAAEVAKQMNM